MGRPGSGSRARAWSSRGAAGGAEGGAGPQAWVGMGAGRVRVRKIAARDAPSPARPCAAGGRPDFLDMRSGPEDREGLSGLEEADIMA